MKTSKLFVVMGIIMLVALMLALTVGLTLAQGTDQPQGLTGTTTTAPGAIPIQGRLTNASGTPLNGTYTMTFRLYDVVTATVAVCSDVRYVVVTNGLFSDYIDGCYNDITGQKLWLGIQVGSDLEMTPRQVIFPVPYALSLVPKAEISGTVGSNDAILDLDNYGTNGKGLRAEAQADTGTNYGVVGAAKSLDGYGGYFYNNGGGIGLEGWAQGPDHPAILGCVAASNGDCNTTEVNKPAGVVGYSINDFGVYGIGSGGVYAIANNTLGVGVWAVNNNNGMAIYGDSSSSGTLLPTLYLVQHNYTETSNFIVAANSLGGTPRFSVDGVGDVKQNLNSDGLVKAGVSAQCGTSIGAGTRFFNNVTSATIVVTGTASGTCTINFGFDVFDRFYVATSQSNSARFVSCYTMVANPNELYCHNWDAAGTAQDGSIMLMVY